MPEINSDILVWARKTCGLSSEDAAKKLQLKDTKLSSGADKLLMFEKGKKPSRSLLVRMSKQYRKPLLTFYMERPPRKGDRGEDFRTLPDGFSPDENVYVDVLIRDIKARQSVLRETLVEEDEAEDLPFVGCANFQQGVHTIAEQICKTLSFNLEKFRNCKNSGDAFKYLRSTVERKGVFVLLVGNLGSHHTTMNTNIFRGFVLADKIAPFIVINDQDAKSAWSFTLLHEITHLWLGQTGVSGHFVENRIEKFCNDVASEILLPTEAFNNFKPNTLDFANLTQEILTFSQSRNISSNLVSYRLLKQGVINLDLWLSLSEFYKNQWFSFKKNQKIRNKKQGGGPSYFVVHRNKLGNALIKFTERMTYSGALTTTKAGLLLGVKPLKVHKLFETGKTI